VERAGGVIRSAWQQLSKVAIPLRCALVGGAVAGALGGVVGLVIGLRTYAPTAWFAILEVGVPAALVGSTLGLIVGSVVRLVPRRRRHLPQP